MANMKMSLEGQIELIGHEGLALSKYLDSVGVWTIGVGATRTEIADLADWPLDKKLTVDEALELFDKSLVRYENAVNKALRVPVSQTQFDALVSICYNIGTGGLTGSTFMRRINQGAAVGRISSLTEDNSTIGLDNKTVRGEEYTEVNTSRLTNGTVVDAIMMWTKPKEITARRKKEAVLYSTGKYSNGGKALLFPVSSKGTPIYGKATTVDVEKELGL